MNALLKGFGWLFFWIVAAAALFLGIVWLTAYSPEQTSELPVGGTAEKIEQDTLTVVAWNIGYAGLGDDMDFFYDGGQSVQTSLGRTQTNLDSIRSFLRRQAAHADLILLQEVDLASKRSYGTNQYDSILAALGPEWHGSVGLNYVSPFVPYPWYNPIGAVRAGVATFSKKTPKRAVRYAYPGGFSWPVSMFNLKRCLLVVEFALTDSTVLTVGNTHNTAYDKGGMREGELAFLRTMFDGKKEFFVAGDWNSTPPGYTPSRAELDDPHFSPLPIERSAFGPDWTAAYDSVVRTARYGYEPYRRGSTTETTIDFLVAGPSVKVLSAECVDLGFRNSDHNPMVYRVQLK